MTRNWKLEDTFCGVYLYISADETKQLIYNAMTQTVDVYTNDAASTHLFSGSVEQFMKEVF